MFSSQRVVVTTVLIAFLVASSDGSVCDSHQFTCGDGITCIDKVRFCDGEQDCPEYENGDEDHCDVTSCSGNLQYTFCGSACPSRCGEKQHSLYCSFMCVPGCFCPNGQYWHRNEGAGGFCYEKEDCPANQHICDSIDPICLNGGECIRFPDVGLENEFYCECRNGFSGQYCEIEAHICDSQSDICNNNGVCLEDGLGYFCACHRMCRGQNCEFCLGGRGNKMEYIQKVNFLNQPLPKSHICDVQESICNGNGVCVKDGAGYYCECSPKCFGKNCNLCLGGWLRRLVKLP